MVSGRSAWRSSEAIAAVILEELGYKVLETHYRVLDDEGREIGEIDIVAEKQGERYAVEVKAGAADLSAIRQAYVNAVIAGMKPMVIARGADDSARSLARRLGVGLIILPDMVLAGSDDLEAIVEAAVDRALGGLAQTLVSCLRAGDLSGWDERLLAAVAESESLAEAASRLGVKPADVTAALGRLREGGLLPRTKSWNGLRAAAALLLLCVKAQKGRECGSPDTR